jgi:hypothetical protein
VEVHLVSTTPAPTSDTRSSLSPAHFALRLSWIVLRVLLALLVMQRGGTFFYQGF